MFGKKKATAGSGIDRQIVGFTKERKILFVTIKPRPIYRNVAGGRQGAQEAQAAQAATSAIEEAESRKRHTTVNARLRTNLAPALVDLGMKITPEQYVAASKRKAAAMAVAVTAACCVAAYMLAPELLILAPLIGIACYMATFNAFSTMPISKTKNIGKDVEKDMLFAARDMIVSMRSGLPLFNAMLTVSVGYGAASKEFKKIIDRVQLGMPMEQAIDEVSEKSASPTFKRLMLQASASIKVGADVVSTIQEVISDVSQERIIELRRYGQRLNAIAMFYMLFGIIFPSMGLAVGSIMSTFISIFPISNQTLVLAAIAIVMLQLVFLKMITSSRPPFAT